MDISWTTIVLVFLSYSTKSIQSMVVAFGENLTSNVEIDTYNSTEISADIQDYGNFTQQFLSCQKVEIDFRHFQILKNRSIFIPGYSSLQHSGLYLPGEYYLGQTGVFVCIHPMIHKEKGGSSQSAEILEYITVICLLLSLLCLFLHFVAFLIVPEMKNLPGKNLASLTVSMFMANLFFLIAKMGYWKTRTCYPLGLAQYYFMMASFFWMNAISFNVFRSFKQITNKLRLIPNRYSFLFYSLYSWTIPAIFLILVVVGDETEIYPEFLVPGFKSDQTKCWFTRKWSAVLFFVVPFGVLIAINAILLVFSAVVIFSNFVKADNKDLGWAKKFFLYSRFALIMGIGWITGLITTFVPIPPFLYMSAVVVTLQGFFIFVAFTRFRKIKTSLFQTFHPFGESKRVNSSLQVEELRLSIKKASDSVRKSVESSQFSQSKPKNNISASE